LRQRVGAAGGLLRLGSSHGIGGSGRCGGCSLLCGRLQTWAFVCVSCLTIAVLLMGIGPAPPPPHQYNHDHDAGASSTINLGGGSASSASDNGGGGGSLACRDPPRALISSDELNGTRSWPAVGLIEKGAPIVCRLTPRALPPPRPLSLEGAVEDGVQSIANATRGLSMYIEIAEQGRWMTGEPSWRQNFSDNWAAAGMSSTLLPYVCNGSRSHRGDPQLMFLIDALARGCAVAGVLEDDARVQLSQLEGGGARRVGTTLARLLRPQSLGEWDMLALGSYPTWPLWPSSMLRWWLSGRTVAAAPRPGGAHAYLASRVLMRRAVSIAEWSWFSNAGVENHLFYSCCAVDRLSGHRQRYYVEGAPEPRTFTVYPALAYQLQIGSIHFHGDDGTGAMLLNLANVATPFGLHFVALFAIWSCCGACRLARGIAADRRRHSGEMRCARPALWLHLVPCCAAAAVGAALLGGCTFLAFVLVFMADHGGKFDEELKRFWSKVIH